MVNINSDYDSVMDRFVNDCARKHHLIDDHRIKIAIQEKPWWLPSWLWQRVICRVVKVQYLKSIEVQKINND